MAVITNTTTTSQFNQLTVREIDFIERFQRNWDSLREIMGIMRPIRKTPGTKLVSSKASITLQSGTVAEGDEVPLSQATVVPVAYADLALQKYRKAVTAESVAKYGANVAVQKTDDALITELQNNVLDSFYTFAQTGALTGIYTTWQMGVAMAIGLVTDKFKKMRRDFSKPIVFVNTLDYFTYLGNASVTVQTQEGIQYVKGFMGADTMILSSELPRNTILATPADNIVLYYIDPADGDFKELGLDYTTGNGETNLIGIHKEGNYGRVMGETHALMGMALWAEYLDGIAVVTVEASGSLGSISGFSTAAGTAKAGDSVLTVPDPSVSGGKYYFKAQASTAPAAPTYLSIFDPTGWTEVVDEQVVSTTNSHKYRVVEVNGAGQAIATADGTVTAKT